MGLSDPQGVVWVGVECFHDPEGLRVRKALP